MKTIYKEKVGVKCNHCGMEGYAYLDKYEDGSSTGWTKIICENCQSSGIKFTKPGATLITEESKLVFKDGKGIVGTIQKKLILKT